MDRWHFTMTRWPRQMFSIRRRMMEDAAFREIIGDYEVASAALQHWRVKDPPGTPRVAGYTRLVRELEDEIEAELNLPRTLTATGCGGGQ